MELTIQEIATINLEKDITIVRLRAALEKLSARVADLESRLPTESAE